MRRVCFPMVLLLLMSAPAWAQNAGVLPLDIPDLAEPTEEQAAFLKEVTDQLVSAARTNGPWESVTLLAGPVDPRREASVSCQNKLAVDQGLAAVWSASLTGAEPPFGLSLRLLIAPDPFFAGSGDAELSGSTEGAEAKVPGLVVRLIDQTPLLDVEAAAADTDDWRWDRDMGNFGFDAGSFGSESAAPAVTDSDDSDDSDDYEDDGERDGPSLAERMGADPDDEDDTEYDESDRTDYDSDSAEDRYNNNEDENYDEADAGLTAAERRAIRREERAMNQQSRSRGRRELTGIKSFVQLRGHGGFSNYYLNGNGGSFQGDIGIQVHKNIAPTIGIGVWAFPWEVDPDRNVDRWEQIANLPVSFGVTVGLDRKRFRPYGGIDFMMVVYSSGENGSKVALGPRFRGGLDIMFSERFGIMTQLSGGLTRSNERAIINHRSLELLSFDENDRPVLRGPLPQQGGFFGATIGFVIKI